MCHEASMIPIFTLSFLSLIFAQIPQQPPESCRLKWTGKWYRNERIIPIEINTTWMDTLGECLQMNDANDHYLFKLEIGSEKKDLCFRCVVFFPVHLNVLRYKQMNCLKSLKDDDSVDSVCRRTFKGDVELKTLFRENSKSEACPFEVPFNFTYVINDRACTSRISTATLCANPNRFRLQYQACPELPDTETHADDFECIAKWDVFEQTFFATKQINLKTSPNPSSKFRCFLHEKSSSEGRMGISADAGCHELTGIENAVHSLQYKLDSRVTSRCHFPTFLFRDHQSHAKRTWKSIVTENSHHFTKDEWLEEWEGQNRSVSLCLDVEDLGNTHRFVVYATHGCNSGYQCVKLVKRKKNILEVIRGRLTSNEFRACDRLENEKIETLLLDDPKREKCPMKGRHSIAECPSAAIHFGCPYEHSIQFRPLCNSNQSQNYLCRGHWVEDEVTYVIAEDVVTGKKVCYVYSSLPEGTARIRSYRHVACHPQTVKHSPPEFDFNSSRFDDCDPTTSAWGISKTNGESASFFYCSLIFISTISVLLNVFF